MAAVVALTAGSFADPAAAQQRGNRERGQQAPQATYSEAFRAAFAPAQALFNAQPRDPQAMRAAVPAIAAAVSTPDDKFAGGQFIYAAGTAASDPALQLQGLGLMLESGKVAAENLGQYNFIAGQIAYQARDFARSRTYLQAAVAAGYNETDPHVLITDTFVQQNDHAGGLSYIGGIVDQQVAAGQVPSRDHLRKALAVAYTGRLGDAAVRYGTLFARHYPASDSWGDAIVVTRTSAQLNDDDVLDLLRLQQATRTFRDGQEYLAFIEMADPRRLPNEVVQVVNEGYASGLLSRENSFASDALATARSRQSIVQGELAGLERDANAASARLQTVVAAGNIFLDAGQPQKAEQFYRKALTMPGADTVTLQNRIGIAQVRQGNYAAAAETFGRVEGNRSAVSQLWAAYAEQRAQGRTTG
ncbi:hypothetical protein EYB45_06910 [Erythrobacteraceae bacterium CFH 75059]|uniref:hypothetical protein n=1 Tax=Qipengyuania thermophila TaxID=2509361 RepID=UPI001021AE72|nr:hypothetical protein [Qipengyuania thermophila]TCD05216.1 hypothetical protein EYB45_06910 [Erythrobacteraceae bacterium CFH 75059]